MTIDAEASARVRADLTVLMADFCRAVSFMPGQLPPYERLYSIFVLGGKLIRNNGDEPEICTVAGFIEPRQHMIATGELTYFEQAESGHLTEVYGNVAHRFSTYQKRGRMDGVDFVTRGIISTQFIRTPQGWRMSSMVWDDEPPGLSIPDNHHQF
jgi:hypothetical protein